MESLWPGACMRPVLTFAALTRFDTRAIRGVDLARREVYFPGKLGRQVEDVMSSTRVLFAGVVALGLTLIFAGSQVATSAQQSTGTAVAVDNNDIGGTVTGPKGPEAGV